MALVARLISVFMVFAAFETVLSAQIVDTTVCAVLADPQSFNGKTVRIQATVQAGFDEFVLIDLSCKQPVKAIWLAYPEGTKGKAGPATVVQLELAKNSPGQVSVAERSSVTLDKNKEFKQFDGLLSAVYKGPGRCLGCVRSTVTATLTGRLDGVAGAGLDRDGKGMITSIRGFGNLNRYSARLLLATVAEVAGHEIDYSKAGALPKSDEDKGSGDPVEAAHQAAKAFGPGNPIGGQIERAAIAYGAPGEDNGVDVAFGGGNEISAKDGEKSNNGSPDGARYVVKLDGDRLKGGAMAEAIAHTGTEIADLRGGKSGDSLFALESRAWQVTIFSAIANREKTLTLPGGFIAWNATWADTDRSRLMADAVKGFLTNWAGLSE